MSTKSSIKWRDNIGIIPGYHLYNEVLDDGDDPPVYLRLDGVHVDLHTHSEPGVSVTITLPRELARELGILKEDL